MKSNDIQVGGSHYKDSGARCPHCGGSIQHWDLFGKSSYLVGNITKYFTRFLYKNGLEDVEKGLHYVQKALDTYFPDQLLLTVTRVRKHAEVTPQTSENGLSSAPSEVASGVVEQLSAEEPGAVQEIADLDEYAHKAREDREAQEVEGARRRAEAFAQAKPHADVPEGYVLEEVEGSPGVWHFRQTHGGNWSVDYDSRTAALVAVRAVVAYHAEYKHHTR